MRKRLPRTSRAGLPIKPSGDLIEIKLRLVVAFSEHAFEMGEVGGVLGNFRSAIQRDFETGARFGGGGGVDAIKIAFTILARREQSHFLQQPEVGGNAGLAEICDLL